MNPWAILDVKPGDSEAQLARAYRKAMFDAHPDRDGGSHERAKLINEAYDELKKCIDPNDRRLGIELPPIVPVIVRHRGVSVTISFREPSSTTPTCPWSGWPGGV